MNRRSARREAVRGGEHRAFDVLAAEAVEQQDERLVGGHVRQIVVNLVAVGGRDVAVGDFGEQRRARRPEMTDQAGQDRFAGADHPDQMSAVVAGVDRCVDERVELVHRGDRSEQCLPVAVEIAPVFTRGDRRDGGVDPLLPRWQQVDDHGVDRPGATPQLRECLCQGGVVVVRQGGDQTPQAQVRIPRPESFELPTATAGRHDGSLDQTSLDLGCQAAMMG